MSRSLRVLHVVRLAEGGMRKHVQILLSKLGDDVEQGLCSSQNFFDSLPPEVREKVRFTSVDIGDSAGPGMLSKGLTIARAARSMGADIIHSHGYKAAIPGVIAARVYGAASVVTGHNLFPKNASFLARASLKFVSMFSRSIIAVAPALTESLVAAGVRSDRIDTILNGIDLDSYGQETRPEVFSEIGLAKSNRMILCAARLTEVKGVDVLIHSAAVLAEEIPEVRIVIAGDGPDEDKLHDLAANTAPRNTIFLGRRDDIARLLGACDMVAIPSRAEGLPMMLAESMASGKPVVASSVGGLADMIADGKNGILVPAGDHIALAEGLCRVLHSSDLSARIGSSARRFAEQNFSEDTMITRTKEVYRCALS